MIACHRQGKVIIVVQILYVIRIMSSSSIVRGSATRKKILGWVRRGI